MSIPSSPPRPTRSTARARRRAALFVALVMGVPSPARACWDGLRASSERIEIAVDADALERTEGERARYARALLRAEALLPDGVRAEVWFGEVSLCPEDDPAGCTPAEPAGNPESIVRVVGALAGAAPAEVQRALALEAPIWTVQLGTWSEPAWAEHEAERLRLLGGPHGAVEIGGFPARNDPGRLRRGEDGLYRVSAGTFLSREAAERARATIASELGIEGEVRPL